MCGPWQSREDRWSSLHGLFPNMHETIRNAKSLLPYLSSPHTEGHCTLCCWSAEIMIFGRPFFAGGNIHISQWFFAVFPRGFHLSPPGMTSFLADWNQQWAPFVTGAAKIVFAKKLKGLVVVPKFPPWFSQIFFPKKKALFLTVILPYLGRLSNERFSHMQLSWWAWACWEELFPHLILSRTTRPLSWLGLESSKDKSSHELC